MQRSGKKKEFDSDASSAIIQRGEEAKALMANEYFKGVCIRVDDAIKAQIIDLKSSAADKFAGLQERRQAMKDLWQLISHEADAGIKELAKAQGEPVKQGRVA